MHLGFLLLMMSRWPIFGSALQIKTPLRQSQSKDPSRDHAEIFLAATSVDEEWYDPIDNRPADRRRRRARDRRHRRGVRDVHVGRGRAPPRAGGELELHLVFALVLRGDPLHRELALCRFRGRRFLDRSLRLAQFSSPTGATL